jgi:tripartite-type tricarboxylate transporter receptor subunit TctC
MVRENEKMTIRRSPFHNILKRLAAAIPILLCCAFTVRADPVADFYRGKKIDVVIALGAGGDYDIHARLLARFMGSHIPGNPVLVPQNMAGAGGLKMANWFATIAPRDGTAIGVLANTMPALQAVGGKGVQFDAAKFFWLGCLTPSVETIAVWHGKGVRTLEDARKKELIVAASSPGAISYAFPKMMNEYLGTKFKIIPGYQGVTAMSLAMERGEVDAHANTWAGWKDVHQDWIDQGKIHILVQNLPKASDLPGIPAVEDLARTEDDRKVIELVVAGNRIGRPFAIPPGVPAERVQALRDAFDATMKDPEFLKAAAKIGVDIAPISGKDMQKIIARTLSIPPRVADAARPLIGN